MQVYDKVNKTELTADTDELIKLMAPGGRQVDLYLKEKKSDEDGYMTWDVANTMAHLKGISPCGAPYALRSYVFTIFMFSTYLKLSFANRMESLFWKAVLPKVQILFNHCSASSLVLKITIFFSFLYFAISS